MSRDTRQAPRTRCLLVWLAATGVAVALVAVLAPDLHGAAPARFDEALVLVCEAALMLCSGWVWLATTVVSLDAARGRSPARRGVPARVRRVVLAACGVALLGGLTQSSHADAAHRDRRPPTAQVHGLPLPDRASAVGHLGRLLARQARARERPTAAVVVRSGDTLWALAHEHLGDGADWSRLYRANRGVVGADPDLIRPGQRLVLPHREESR